MNPAYALARICCRIGHRERKDSRHNTATAAVSVLEHACDVIAAALHSHFTLNRVGNPTTHTLEYV
jgi:hypothetical protein